MDAALLTQRLRNQAIALAPKVKASDKSNATTFGSQVAGSGTFWVNGVAQGGCDCTPPSSTPQPVPYPLQSMIFASLEIMFNYISAINCGPTRASRFLYLWMFTVTSAYRWTQRTSDLSGVIDNWNWTTRRSTTPFPTSTSISSWMTQVLAYTMPILAPPTTAAQILQLERNLQLWTPLDQATQSGYVRTLGHFTVWQAAWSAWYALRQTDGFVAAQAPPTFAQLPNGGILMDPAICQDITTYPNPYQWTPLVLNSIPKQYYTRTWETVRSVVLTAANDTSVKATAAPYFPGYNTTQRTAEINDVVAKTATLGIPGVASDTNKVTAEFWAGGPNTVTPPGMFMWLWRQYALAFRVAQYQGYDTLLYSGLDLAVHLFEAGRLAWGIKLQYQEARPIQEIRRLYPTTDLSGWETYVDVSGVLQTAPDISGCLWVPYQEQNFVTPPFPDFISGHSCYSEVFALVMGDWYGPTIPTSDPVVAYDLPLYSPMFSGSQSQPFGVFQIASGSSRIQPGLVPATPITLSFATWQDIATSAGISRQWGGIHAESAHTGGQAAAVAIHTFVSAALNLPPAP